MNRVLTLSREGLVEEFNRAFGHTVRGTPFWTEDELMFRLKLIQEEMKELEDAIHDVLHSPYEGCEEAMLKEMTDVQYTLSGLAVSIGVDLDEAFLRTHASNMSKLGEDGKPIYREDGKVLKGPNYRKPYLTDLVKGNKNV